MDSLNGAGLLGEFRRGSFSKKRRENFGVRLSELSSGVLKRTNP